MQTESLGDYIRQLREHSEMPLRKLAALLDIDQSTLELFGNSFFELSNQAFMRLPGYPNSISEQLY